MLSYGLASGSWSDIGEEEAAARGVTLVRAGRPTREHTERALRSGLRPVIGQRFALEDAAAAHAAIEARDDGRQDDCGVDWSGGGGGGGGGAFREGGEKEERRERERKERGEGRGREGGRDRGGGGGAGQRHLTGARKRGKPLVVLDFSSTGASVLFAADMIERWLERSLPVLSFADGDGRDPQEAAAAPGAGRGQAQARHRGLPVRQGPGSRPRPRRLLPADGPGPRPRQELSGRKSSRRRR